MTKEFIRESNRIEGIIREPTQDEIREHERFMKLSEVTIAEMERFVSVYQPGAVLRDKAGLDVTVGDYRPIPGGPRVRQLLTSILLQARMGMPPFTTHMDYEGLHPFTDSNGRSGRMLWAWQMKSFPLGFLHHFYYQSLAHNA